MKAITKYIRPLWYALISGLIFSSKSWRELEKAILSKYGRYFYNTVEIVRKGQKILIERPEGTPIIDPIMYRNGQPIYDKQEVTRALQPVRLIYLWLHLTIDKHNKAGLPDSTYLERRYGYKLPVRPKGKPKVRWVSTNWWHKSALYKIIYSAKLSGQYNLFVEPGTQPQLFKTGEFYIKSLNAFRDYVGTIWFNQKIVTSVYQLIRPAELMTLKKESYLGMLRHAHKVNLIDKDGKPKTGEYITKNQLNWFYRNNPNGELWVANGKGGLELLIPEDRAYYRSYAKYVGVYTEDPELLEDDKIAKEKAAYAIAQRYWKAYQSACMEPLAGPEFKQAFKTLEDLLPRVYANHPWLIPNEESTEE